MKLMSLAILAAATLAVPMASQPADAQPRHPDRARHERHATWRTVCTTRWVHHHRVRTCHRVRVWR